MKFTQALVYIQLIAPCVLADHTKVPLPGLDSKPHLWHLKREDIATDKLMNYTVKGPVVRSDKKHVVTPGQDQNGPLTQE